MAIYSCSMLLAQLTDQTESHIRKAISEWQNSSAGRMNHSPAPGAWSATQCLEHLNVYGRYYIPAIKKAIEAAGLRAGNPSTTFESGWLGNWFTNLMEPDVNGQVKKKMKAPASARPASELDASQVIAEFIEQQEKLLQLYRQAATLNLNNIRVPISIAPFIRLKLGDVFRFLVAHNKRHVLQAERALRTETATTPALPEWQAG